MTRTVLFCDSLLGAALLCRRGSHLPCCPISSPGSRCHTDPASNATIATIRVRLCPPVSIVLNIDEYWPVLLQAAPTGCWQGWQSDHSQFAGAKSKSSLVPLGRSPNQDNHLYSRDSLTGTKLGTSPHPSYAGTDIRPWSVHFFDNILGYINFLPWTRVQKLTSLCYLPWQPSSSCSTNPWS